eukprot:SAG11_NODE_1280_length_5314_cov_2.956472_4_plen_61_part_00
MHVFVFYNEHMVLDRDRTDRNARWRHLSTGRALQLDCIDQSQQHRQRREFMGNVAGMHIN